MFERCVGLERTVVAAALRDRAVFWSLSGYLDSGDFSVSRYRMVWEALRTGGQVPDLPDVGEETSSTMDPQEAARQLKTLSALRRVNSLCESTRRVLSDGRGRDPGEVLNSFVRDACSCLVPRQAGAVLSPEEWLRRGYESIERRANGTNPGFDLGLGRLTEGLSPEPGHLLILAGETGKGKTALALNLAVNLGVALQEPVLFVNTEMSWEELAFRLYALLGQTPVTRLRRGDLTEEELGELRRLSAEWEPRARLWITDGLPWATVSEVAALARQGAASAGIRVVILDWVQRLEPSDPRKEMWQVLLEAGKQLKSLAQELNVLVIAVAQLTENHHLALSRGLSREADGEVWLVDSEGQGTGTHYLEVHKARHAPAGAKIPLNMDRATLRFYEAEGTAEEQSTEQQRESSRRRNRS